MRTVQFTPRARRDVIEIWEYIARDNFEAADRVVAAIKEATRMLAELPGIGYTRPDVHDTRYRFWRVYSYLLAYRASDEALVIVRVVHGARDLRDILNPALP